MNKKIIIWIIVILVVLGGIYFFVSSKSGQPGAVNTTQNTGTSANPGNLNTVVSTTTTTVTTTVINPAQTAIPTTPVKTTPAPKIAPKTYAISIANFSFNPNALNINKGDTVAWTNNDSVPHQIASNTFNGPVISRGQSYTFVFETAGTFNYHCAIHPSMTGVITVK